jgi:hypothetical protein
LQGQITALNQALQAESTERTTQDLLLSQRIDENAKQIKENKVSSSRKTITITGPTENGTNIDVNVDNKTIVVNESGTLSVSSDALVQYVGENAINVSDVTGGAKTISLVVNPNDKILTNDVQGLLATLSLKWNHADATGEKDEIQLIGKDGIVISRIDVADFIKDGMLDNVVLNSVDANNPYLSFTFNSASGKETINVPVKDLVDIYFAGNGLELNENTFSIKIDNSSEVFLTVSNDGLKLSGIQTAIDKAKLEVQTIITNEVEVLTTAISNLTNDLNDEVNNRLTADNKIENDYKTADTQLRSEFKTADDKIENDYKTADTQLRSEFAAKDTELKSGYEAADDAVRSEFKTADDTVRSEFILADTQLRSEFKSADNAIRSEFKTADDAVRSEFVLADTQLRTEFKSADDAVRSEFKTADDTVRSEFKTADDAVRSEFVLADTQLRSELIGVTTNLETAYKEADKAIEDAYKEADNAIGLQITTINGNIDALSTKADGILPLAQQYTNEKVSELVAANELVKQELRTNIENNAKEISKLTGDVSIDGSIKDIVFDSALGAIVNTITVDDATEQSLVKKFTLDGTPYIYVSNNTSDMKHNGDALNTVIDELSGDINETINVTEEIKNDINVLTLRVDGHDDAIANINAEVANNKIEISVLNNEVADIKNDIAEIRTNITDLENSINTTITGLLAPMQEAITALQKELANTKAELETLKANAITSMTGVANEISVTVTDNTAVVGFAEDAYFVAG